MAAPWAFLAWWPRSSALCRTLLVTLSPCDLISTFTVVASGKDNLRLAEGAGGSVYHTDELLVKVFGLCRRAKPPSFWRGLEAGLLGLFHGSKPERQTGSRKVTMALEPVPSEEARAVFGLAAKMPVSHPAVPGSRSWFPSQFQLPAGEHSERQQGCLEW